MTTASETIAGNRIEVELDNATARGWLLSAIDASRQRVHLQVYMALDDDVGRPVEAALAAAGARGVTVRVLVDSLHGLHGSFGAHNPILERLSSRPGVELRVSKPITGPAVARGPQAAGPSQARRGRWECGAARRTQPLARVLRRLRGGAPDARRDVADGAVARRRRTRRGPCGGRAGTLVPAGLDRCRGSAVRHPGPAPAGPTTARVVVHRGLRDANTLEAYLALIETARSHVYAVNGFPLLLEIQHALLRALRRGVRVRTLFGNLTPRHGDRRSKGHGRRLARPRRRSSTRGWMHSLPPEASATSSSCRQQPGWDPGVGDVRPHVHAKVMSADGRVCAVGSANLDVTAGYWESELLLVVEDEAVARAVEARFDELIAASARVDRDDPEWRRRAEQRGWMRYWPGMLSG